MRAIFDEPEHLHVGATPSRYEEYQESSFRFVSGNDPTDFPRFIRETRSVRRGKRTLTVYREYVWNPFLQHFRMLGADLTK
jgi:hypothetical protein